MAEIFDKLKAEFPREAISWRAQSLNKDGTSAMALAYIDARDVMQRLDEVCGPDGWQCRYPHAGAKTVCEIGIFYNQEWLWKADGAGDSDIEAEKGALSDAFKRAAVRWGIGRYLYDLASPWVPCEHYLNHQGKKVWKKWTQDPWSQIRTPSAPTPGRNAAGPGQAPPATGSAANISVTERMVAAVGVLKTAREVFDWWNLPKVQDAFNALSPAGQQSVEAAKARRLAEIEGPFQEAAE
jgi:hypothetical protein